MVDFPLPAAIDGRHLLALPAGTEIEGYATAWFPEASWDRHPVRETDTAGAARPAGTRFRGTSSAPQARSGRLRLSDAAVLDGPHRVDAATARSLGLPARDVDLYGLDEPTGAGILPTGWMEAVARRTGGAVGGAHGAPWLLPDPGALVDLALWTGVMVPAAELMPLVRPSFSGTRLGAVQPLPGRGAQAFAVTAESGYDGALVLTAARPDEVPLAVAGTDWGRNGPWSYAVSWVPEDPFELEHEAPSRLHVIARSRMAPSIARAMATLWRVAGGTVVDAAGFVVTPDELAARSATPTR